MLTVTVGESPTALPALPASVGSGPVRALLPGVVTVGAGAAVSLSLITSCGGFARSSRLGSWRAGTPVPGSAIERAAFLATSDVTGISTHVPAATAPDEAVIAPRLG